MMQLMVAMVAFLLPGWFRSGRVGAGETLATAPAPDHPLVGDWFAVTPAGEISSTFASNHTVRIRFPRQPVGLPGICFVGEASGGWEATGQRAAAFVVTQPLTTMAGTSAGVATITAFVTVSKDGRWLIDSGAHGKITLRDANGDVAMTVHRFERLFPQRVVSEPVPAPGRRSAPPQSSPCHWVISAERREQAGALRRGENLKR